MGVIGDLFKIFKASGDAGKTDTHKKDSVINTDNVQLKPVETHTVDTEHSAMGRDMSVF